MLIIGYDPGGEKKNGVALLRHVGCRIDSASCHTCDCVDQALAWIHEQVGKGNIDAAGIDSLLSWGSGPGGWRPMDQVIRKHYREVLLSVMSPNSLRGSMALQGMSFAMELRALQPAVKLNETHPKVQYYATTGKKHDFKGASSEMTKWLLDQLHPSLDFRVANDHEWDALFSAWATLMGLSGGWTNDLIRHARNEKLITPAGEVTYYWPENV